MPTIEDLDYQFVSLVSKYNFWHRVTEVLTRTYSALAGAILLALLLSARDVMTVLYSAFIIVIAFYVEVAIRRKRIFRLAMLTFLDIHRDYKPKNIKL